ncbi:hypothetical protein ABZ234_13150 [Nocardiopsis sp. NPDC006198]|uniref:hypothetical protein n=1 Tax=Nocardiopsis sp. NPDC006198 TaxID=3154472 RepID=UPI0033B495D3
MIDPGTIDLAEFLHTWYGAPSRRAAPLPDSCDWLPGPLKDWHTLARRWDTRLTHTTSMIPPEKILPTDGKAVFMVDSTADWRWCIDPDEPDSVFDAEEYDPVERNPERLADFLVHNTVREAAFGAAARTWAPAVPDEALPEILSPMEEVAFGAWKWPVPGCRIFLGDGALAEIVEVDPDSGWEVHVAAPGFASLSRLENISGAHWRTPGGSPRTAPK